ncbi:uncharacterized protein M421DRAFT_176557 [Didymella exigua CBS 183.55]|uniref:Uncharacterized protein n=1 Tax=Didymella exigua CBS 183.55 TaxID=1150837 RepID=A0A6A5RI97_9PLEO|nr:uncharacterized protein M421DRAFT_176557 [Didymella exigua CBS 183.55]KAF1927299.1 hypothetical protein M421DRAFT_176557 [Didymella exigua CBS 183.55]
MIRALITGKKWSMTEQRALVASNFCIRRRWPRRVNNMYEVPGQHNPSTNGIRSHITDLLCTQRHFNLKHQHQHLNAIRMSSKTPSLLPPAYTPSDEKSSPAQPTSKVSINITGPNTDIEKANTAPARQSRVFTCLKICEGLTPAAWYAAAVFMVLLFLDLLVAKILGRKPI